MNTLTITGLIFGCTFGSALLGMLLRARLPEEHLSHDTKETVKLATGIVGTMTAVLLGLLVASAKSTFDTQRNGIAQLAANTIMLDRTLAHLGEEARDVRPLLRDSVTDFLNKTWPEENAQSSSKSPSTGTEGRYETLLDKVLQLTPKTDAQKTLQSQSLKLIMDTGELRWLLYSQRESSISVPLFVMMVFWLAISFASFGLFAPRNATAIIALAGCALAVASALFLILELDRPFRGMIRISSAPVHKTLEQLGR